MRHVSIENGGGAVAQRVRVTHHELQADEPVDKGGTDTGPAPHELLLAALGTCTAMTLRMYAAHKAWPLTEVRVELDGRHEEERFVIATVVHLEGDLSRDQRRRLLEIASRCPVHRTLSGPIAIETREATGV